MTRQDHSFVHAGPTSASNVNCRPLEGGHEDHCDLPESSIIFQIETTYGFTPLMISVGTAYFRRLAASNQAMLQVSSAHPSFNIMVEALTFEEPGKPLVGAIHAPYLSNEVWLTLIHLTCTYIAAKNLAYIPWRGSLRTIMGHIYGVQSCEIDPELSRDLEIQCLEALDWKVGLSAGEQHSLPYAADRELHTSAVACHQEQPGNHETENSILPSEESTANADPGWTANLKEPSIVTLGAVEPGLAAGLSSLLPKAQASSAQSVPITFKLDRSVQPHRAVHWVWILSSMFLMFLLIATCFDTHFSTYFIAVAFLPSLLGQQTAYWGLAFKGWGHDTQRRRANWNFKALQASAIITALCSAAVAARITYVISQQAADGGPLQISTSRASMEGFIGVCYALHAVVATAAAKNAYQVQSIPDRKNDAVMV